MGEVSWVILTQGNRPGALAAAVRSVGGDALVVVNSSEQVELPGVRSESVMRPGSNLGIPAGRDFALEHSDAEIVGFLDDDAVAGAGISDVVVDAFEAEARLGAVALRLVDEDGRTVRRHVPRPGGRNPERAGEVATFLGGACAIRREAYLDAGGYWGDLFYGHEELELSWRLIDRGWMISYLPEVRVFHPRTQIARHPDGWRMTGRNRVMIARRTLPWPVALIHVFTWFVLGTLRAPDSTNRDAYLRGWWSGWAMPVAHKPIRWRTVWRLTRLGRPPVL